MKHITEQYFDEMVKSLQNCLQIDTVKSPAEKNAPFGAGNAKCLEQTLALAGKLGFDTFNCDNYSGHAEFGQGEEVFGVLGHLDVVPAEGSWSVNPFSGEIKNGYIYGRGAVDNKGPMISCLYALKALKDSGLKPKKKIRVIFGCDEESGGWQCMEHYAKKFKMPQSGFSPDGDFPVINREKGLYHFILDLGAVDKNIISFNSGLRLNVVPDSATAEIKKVPFDINTVKEFGVTVEEKTGSFVLSAGGFACHGSYPQKGDNAAWKIFKALNAIFPADKAVKFVADKLCKDFNGLTWGFPFEDEPSGKLTHNIGKVRIENNRLLVGIDIRYPVTYTDLQIENAITANSPPTAKIIKDHSQKPLYVPDDCELVQNLLEAYRGCSGNEARTIAVGGATYARCLPQGVAFGPVFPGDEKVIHCVDERISLERLKLITKIYYEAIKLNAF